jgi:hypothetical protein
MPKPSMLAWLLVLASCSAPPSATVVLKSGQELEGEIRSVSGGVIEFVEDDEEEPLLRQHVRVIEGTSPFADPPVLWRQVPWTDLPQDQCGSDLSLPRSWVRVRRDDRERAGSLDVGTGGFERADGRRVYLVGAVHVAHADTFERQQDLLDSMDLVLWEGVGAKERPSAEAMERFDVLAKAQILLKNLLNLEFQVRKPGELTGIDYDRSFWRNSDMSADALQAELDRRGLSIVPNEALFKAVFGALFKVVDPAKVPRNESTGRAYRGLVAPLMADTERIFSQAGAEGLKSVLLEMRNERVMEELANVLAAPGAPDRIAIYYGAAHLPGMARALTEEMGFTYLGVHWVEAWRF